MKIEKLLTYNHFIDYGNKNKEKEHVVFNTLHKIWLTQTDKQ